MSTRNQLAALRALEAIGSASYSEWRDAAPEVPRGSFARVVRALVDGNLVTEVEGSYRPASAETDTDGNTDTPATDTTDTPTDTNATNRVSKPSGLRAWSLQHGGMIDHSVSLRRKGYLDSDESDGDE